MVKYFFLALKEKNDFFERKKKRMIDRQLLLYLTLKKMFGVQFNKTFGRISFFLTRSIEEFLFKIIEVDAMTHDGIRP